MVCPYSLTIPGGVQMQVLALARDLRALGFVVQVLAPCDGAPPEAGVTPLGKSIPWATNGSVAPIAPDPSAAVRTIRALRSEEFDVVHIHEPFVPGPSLTALLFCDQPTVGTFHRAGASRAYQFLGPLTRRVGKRLTRRVAVSQDALDTARDGIGGEFTVLFNGIDVDRFASAAPMPTDGPTVLFFGRHEPRKGLGVLLEAAAALPDDAFLLKLQAAFGGRLGAFLRAGRRQVYPLALTRVRELTRPRLALIGNAAHTVHPVAGQGFNLGLRDVALLAELLSAAHTAGRDPGDAALLADYAAQRRRDNLVVSGFTDGLVRVFSNDFLPLAVARNLGLIAVDLLPPLKRGLMRRTMGLAGRLPRLARGLPLR